jgi:hypothetical protein
VVTAPSSYSSDEGLRTGPPGSGALRLRPWGFTVAAAVYCLMSKILTVL